MKGRTARYALLGVGFAAALGVEYIQRVEPWMLHWGATDAEIDAELPGERRYHDRGRQVAALVEPETALVLVSPADWRRLQQGARARGAWSFFLAPNDDGRTRFIIRSSGGPVGSHVFAALHFLMEQKMMRGLRDRAEPATS